ncbi:MAG: HDOD domain-containing protein [Gammaproteobacteria bacterium]|nr:HDOD domain-containing protein [Gammaproteobacteria bacterium]
MQPQLNELISDISELVTLPEICLKVTKMVEEPDTTADDIGKVISQDPSLTLKVLKLSNSAMYGFEHRVDTVSRAITLIGTRQVRDLVLAASAFETFKGIDNSLMTMADFWYHSILCGLAANQLTKYCGLRNADGLFVAGLLHDIGQLIEFNQLPEQSQQAILLTMEGPEECEMYQAEELLMGFNHMDVGQMIAENWQLPAYMKYCIGYHHLPASAPDFKQQVSIIHIANTIAVLAELNTDDPELAPAVEDYAWQQTGLDATVFPAVIESILKDYDEVEKLLNL